MTLSELLKELVQGRGAIGEAVDIDVERLAREAGGHAGSRDGIWKQSSFELQRGLEVSEEPLDSMPAELIDVFRNR
ncbi:MAG: hypothetical protein ABW220_17845 [Burkholderiaceae bacterium]